MKRDFYYGDKLIRSVSDDLAVFDTIFNFSRPVFTMLKGDIYDPEKYDLVLKPNVVEKEIAKKEEELRQVELRNRQQEERLKEEIDSLRKLTKTK